MAVDKLVDSTQLDANLTSVANAIRTKGGTSAPLAFPAGFVSAVQAIPTGTTPTGTKQISINQNGTTIEDVAAYANAEITVNVSGGGSVPLLIDSAEITIVTTANHLNRVSIQLTPIVNGFVAVYIDEFPTPDASVSTALWWLTFVSSAGTAGGNALLRTNGSIGSDGSMCIFTKTTGLLQLGGQYGNFIAGLKYNILEFEFPTA